MAKIKIKNYVIFLFLGALVYSSKAEEKVERTLLESTSCNGVCENTYPLHTYPDPDDLSSCKRGCRLFSILDMVEEFVDLDVARNSCKALCDDAYEVEVTQKACHLGCNNQKSFFLPFHQLSAQLESEFFRPDPFDGGFMYPLMYAHNFYSNMVDKLSDSMRYSWSFYTQPEDGRMMVVRSQPKFLMITHTDNGEDKPETYLETNLIVNDDQSSALDDFFPSQAQNRDLPYRVGERDLSTASTEEGQDWLSCVSSRTGLSKLVICLTVFLSCLGMIWLCLTTSATGREQRLHVKPEKLSFYGDLEYLKEAEVKKTFHPQALVIEAGEQAGPLPLKIPVRLI